MALLPLRGGGQWLGLVEFLWSEPHAFSAEERFYFRRMLESLEAVVARRRAYVARQRSEARYRTVFQTTGTAMVIIEDDTTLSLVNEEYERLSGYTREEVEGKASWTETVVPEDRERMMRYHRLRRSDPEAPPGQYEFRFVDRDGEIKDILAAIDLIPGTRKSVVSLLDITERKRAKQALERQLERVSLLNEIARSIVARHDLKSVFREVVGKLEDRFADLASIWLREGESDVFTLASAGDRSRQALEQFNLPQQMAVPATLAESLTGGDMRYLDDLAPLDEPVLEQLDVRSAVVAPLVAEGGVLGVLVSGRYEEDAFSGAERDFLEGLSKHVALAVHQTQLHQSLQEAYDDLRQTQRAMLREERLRALGEMASGIAHDINNAISPIPLYTAIVGQEEGLSQRARTHLRTIEMAVKDVEETVGRMRQFYREREEEDLAPVRVNHAVQQAIELTRPRWRDLPQEHGYVIHLVRDFEDDLPPVVGNEGEIRQAVTNLIFNAVDAMPDGGTLSLRTRLDERPPAQIVVEVSDTGIGMDEETQRRCLQPFFSTKGERGSGMGLATTYGTMQRHGGDVQVESTLGEGTTMRLLFPLREAADEEGVEVAAVPVSPLRILCVDDEPLVRDALQEVLQDAGHSVALADGGEAALEQFEVALYRGEPFDVVITDLGMPGVTGRQVAQGVKAASPETPVILLTGWGQQLSAEDDIPAAVDLLLNKPPSVEGLSRALARVTSSSPLPAQ
jgi:PAS domain S-box-containing protein